MTRNRSPSGRGPDAGTALRAELYLRGDTYGIFDRQQEVLNRVGRLEANGVFSDSLVAGEWQRVRTRAEDWRPEAVETYEAFRSWARQNGFSLEPAFRERTRSFIGMDEVEDVVVFPAVALAIYDGRELAAVFPCTDEDRTYAVADALDAFERGDGDWLTRFESVTVERAEPRLAGDATAG